MIVYISAGMRTGSSHIARALGTLLDHRVSSPRLGFAGRASTDDHQIDHNVIAVQQMEGRFVLHQHSKAIGNNLHLLKTGGYKPIVIQRNLFDCLVSIYDQMPASPHMTVPGVMRPEWMEMDEDSKWEWLAYNVIPWYTTYYASWHYADIEKLFVWYGDFYRDQVAGMQTILEFIDAKDTDADAIELAVHKKDQSFHIGQSGRGKGVPKFVKYVAGEIIKSWGPLAGRMRDDLLGGE